MTEPPWLTLARSYLGMREVKGTQHNPTILRWWAAIRSTIRDDETPWCAAFTGGVLEESGFRSSRSPAARSYINWGARLDYDALGCVVILSRPPSPWSGHVGFLAGSSPMGVVLLGGNQGDAVSLAWFPRGRVIGRRWPMPIDDDALLPIHFTAVPTLNADGSISEE